MEYMASKMDDMITASENTYVQMCQEIDALKSLVDGAMDIVELFQPESPSQVTWKENWLKSARNLLNQTS